MGLHPLVIAAAQGRLPDWARAGPERREHVARVSVLLDGWAVALGLEGDERVRWRAAGTLHDALRDADPDDLRPRVPPRLRAMSGPLLHGPAAAERLRIEGVRDGELLLAVAYHTVGHPAFGRLGRALYAADFLEPGRDLLPEWRGELRGRMPEELDDVVRGVLGARMRHQIAQEGPVRPETLAFWNLLADEAS